MQFLCFIHYSFNVWALEQGYLSDHSFKRCLLGSEVKVGQMPNCFETIGVVDSINIFWYEPVENFLVGEIFIIKL